MVVENSHYLTYYNIMKKILPIILIMFLSMQICFAEGEVEEDIDSLFNEQLQEESPLELHGYLQYSELEQTQDHLQEQDAVKLDDAVVSNRINFTNPKKIESKSLISGIKKPTFHPFQDQLEAASRFTAQEYDIKPVSSYFVQNIGNFSFGTSYDSYMYSAQANYSTGVFTKYDWKRFAIKASFAKNTNSNYDSYSDKFYIAPELKITKRLSLLDVMQTDVYQINKKNEVVLRYTPHIKKYADDVQLEVGAGQSFYNDAFVKSSVRFSTRFKL